VSPTWAAVLARRLVRHGLADPVPGERLAAQVGAMGGAHAQVMSAAEVSVALRVAGATRVDVREALWTDRRLVKAYGPRGTVHLLPAPELGLWTSALAEASDPRPPDGLSTDETDQLVGAIAEALAEADLTLAELGLAVVERVGAWAGVPVPGGFAKDWPRWTPAIHAAARRGELCFGANRGRHVTYASPRRWVPGYRAVDDGRALAEVARRYLHAYGPATADEFGRWFGASRARARSTFSSLALETVVVDGAAASVLTGDAGLPDERPRGVRLLPYFDAYAVGCHPRSVVFPGRAADRALAGGQAGNFPVLLVDGVVAGVWHQRRSGRKLQVTVEPFGPFRRRRELDEQVERLGAIQEARPDLTLGRVTVGPHA
jgi:hypothetical protein